MKKKMLIIEHVLEQEIVSDWFCPSEGCDGYVKSLWMVEHWRTDIPLKGKLLEEIECLRMFRVRCCCYWSRWRSEIQNECWKKGVWRNNEKRV